MSFTFIPRKVARKTVNSTRGLSNGVPQPIPSASAVKGKEKAPHTNPPNGVTLNHSDATTNGSTPAGKAGRVQGTVGSKRKLSEVPAAYLDEDYAALVWLALSDYALWSDPYMRRMTESSGDEGFIPLTTLLRRSTVISHLHLERHEVAVAKALRTCADDVLEVRMIVASTSSSATWRSDDVGSYEVRRRKRVDSGAMTLYSKAYWDARTVYVENVPAKYASLPGIANFTSSLLQQDNALQTIQSVTFLPHHLDKEGVVPKPKPFGLVMLSSLEDVDALLTSWPWERRKKAEWQEGCEVYAQEALKYGFRALRKSRWQELNDEYLARRQKILSEMPADDELVEQSRIPSSSTHETQSRLAPKSMTRSVAIENPQQPALMSRRTEPHSAYPYDCLVFVKHLHTETNKTTLRSLFSRAFNSSEAAKAINYVDYNKGMDSCHLRLSSPQHALTLLGHFDTHPTCQSTGLDDSGKEVSKEGIEFRIEIELVQGKREEIYWDKVPEKVRRESVRQALGLEDAPSTEDGRDRKRRRKG